MSPQLQQFLLGIDRILRTALFRVGDDSISLLWVLKLILAFLTVVIVSNLFKRLLRDYLLRRLKLSQGNREALATLISYSAGALIFLLILATNGLNLASLAVVLGGLGVGIGFGLQDVTKNLVSGLTLLAERKLQVGDYIEFAGLSGYIKEIAMRSTVIRTFDGGDAVVPNSNLVSDPVLNWSYKNFTGKIRLPIGVAYESDPVSVTETLLDSAYMESAVLHDPPPKVVFKGFGDSALNFELWVWVSRIDEGISVRSSLNFIIDYNFRRAGIKMPFPQRDLWLRNPEVLQFQSDVNRRDADGQDVDSRDANGQENAVNTGQNIVRNIIQNTGQINSPTHLSIRSLLRQVPYFQNSSDLHLRQVIEAGYRKVLAESEVLFNAGEMGTAVYIILSGAIETVAIQLNQHIKTYYAGEFFGEAPIMLDIPYFVTACALEETSVFVIQKNNFEKLLRNCPKLSEVLAEELSKEKATYIGVRQQLQAMGLLDMDEHHHRFLDWMQARLKQFLSSQ